MIEIIYCGLNNFVIVDNGVVISDCFVIVGYDFFDYCIGCVFFVIVIGCIIIQIIDYYFGVVLCKFYCMIFI